MPSIAEGSVLLIDTPHGRRICPAEASDRTRKALLVMQAVPPENEPLYAFTKELLENGPDPLLVFDPFMPRTLRKRTSGWQTKWSIRHETCVIMAV